MDKATLFSLIRFALVVGLVMALSATIVWARQTSASTRAALGGMLMLLFGGAVVPPKETQTIEQAKEDKGKKGAESGDPPSS